MRKSGIVTRLQAVLLASTLAFAALPARAETVVNIWHTEPNPKSRAAIDEIIADFEKENPDIKVAQEAIGWGDLDTKLQAALASGALPEAAHGQSYVARSLSAKGMLRPLNDVVDSIGADDIFDVIKKLDYNEEDGNYYGLAHAVGVDLIVYRKDMFKDAGLAEEAPKTWGEWVDQLKALTKDTNGDGQPDQFGISLAGQGFFTNEDFYMLTGSNGGRLFDEQGRPTFTEKPVIEVLELWKEITTCCAPPDWPSRSFLDTVADIATGRTATILGYGRATEYFEQYAPDLVAADGVGVFDSKPVGPSGEAFLTQLDAEPWMIFKDSPHPEEAAKFLKFFYQPDNYLKYIATVPIHFFPITKSLREDPRYQALPELERWKFWVDKQQKVIEQDDPRPIMMTQWQDLKLPFIAEIASSAIIVDMVVDVTVNGMEPQAAAERGQQRAEQLIEQLGYRNW